MLIVLIVFYYRGDLRGSQCFAPASKCFLSRFRQVLPLAYSDLINLNPDGHWANRMVGNPEYHAIAPAARWETREREARPSLAKPELPPQQREFALDQLPYLGLPCTHKSSGL